MFHVLRRGREKLTQPVKNTETQLFNVAALLQKVVCEPKLEKCVYFLQKTHKGRKRAKASGALSSRLDAANEGVFHIITPTGCLTV